MHISKITTNKDGFPLVTPQPFKPRKAIKTLVNLFNSIKSSAANFDAIPTTIFNSFIQLRGDIINNSSHLLKSPNTIFTSQREGSDIQALVKYLNISQKKLIEILSFASTEYKPHN